MTDPKVANLRSELAKCKSQLKTLTYNYDTTLTEMFHINKPLEKAKQDLSQPSSNLSDKDKESLSKLIKRNSRMIEEYKGEIQDIQTKIDLLKPKIEDLERQLLPYDIVAGMKFS